MAVFISSQTSDMLPEGHGEPSASTPLRPNPGLRDNGQKRVTQRDGISLRHDPPCTSRVFMYVHLQPPLVSRAQSSTLALKTHYLDEFAPLAPDKLGPLICKRINHPTCTRAHGPTHFVTHIQTLCSHLL